MSGLHDANLRNAYDEIADVRQALDFLSISNSSSPDQIHEILSWIDWDSSKVAEAATHLGRVGWATSAIGEMRHSFDILTQKCGIARGAWSGAAADTFQNFSQVVLQNGQQVINELNAMATAIGDAPGAMEDLTKSVWKSAGGIADDPKVKKAIADIYSNNDHKRHDAMLELTGALAELKRGVENSVDRIDNDVLPIIKKHTARVELRNPAQSPVGYSTGFRMDYWTVRKANREMRVAIAGIKRAKNQLGQAWRAIPSYTFGTSASAQAVVRAWQTAIESRMADVETCYREAKGVFGGSQTAMVIYREHEGMATKDIEKAVSPDIERHRLIAYSSGGHGNFAGKGPDGLGPDDNEVGFVEDQLNALDNGWGGRGATPPDPGPTQPDPTDFPFEKWFRRGAGDA